MPAPATLRPVDPRRRRGPLYRAYAHAVGTRPAAWVSRAVMWKLDPHLLRLTGGHLGVGLMLPTALLETTGARTGQVRRNVVLYFHDGDRVILVASKAGAPEHPAWYHNARAHPAVQLNGQPFTAETVEDQSDRDRLWDLADLVFPPYAAYRQRARGAGRTVPILRLSPA